MFNGKEQQLWTQTQLESLGKIALKQRAMDIRDLGGADNLPPMPRHPELMVPWIMQVQNAMMSGCGKPAAYADMEKQDSRANAQQEPQQGYQKQQLAQYEDD